MTTKRAKISMLAVQSILCGILLTAALLLRFFGGGWFDACRTVLRDAMTDLSFVQTLAEEWKEAARA